MPRLISSCAQIALVAVVVAAAFTGCRDETELDLLDAPAGEDDELIRRSQYVQVLDLTVDPPEVKEVSTGEFMDEVLQRCLTDLTATLCPTALTEPLDCGEALCTVGMTMCFADDLVQASGTAPLVIDNRATTGKYWEIREQRADVKSTLLFQARYSAGSSSFRMAIEALRGATTPSLPDSAYCNATELAVAVAGVTRGQRFSTYAVDAYHLYNEAAQLEVQNRLAVADSHFSSSSSVSRTAGRAMSHSLFSRSAAARLLVDHKSIEEEGLLGATTTALCSSPSHTPQIEAAIQVLREAAPPPSEITGSASLTSLLVGTRTNGSVRQRLGELWDNDDLKSTTDIDEFLAYVGLELEDFAAARSYLTEEINAFSRTQEPLPARVLAGGTTSTYLPYAGTASVPVSPDATYWTGLVRRYYDSSGIEEPRDDRFLHGNPVYPALATGVPMIEAELGVGFFIDAALSSAAQIVDAEASITDPDLRADITDLLALLISDGAHQRPGRLEFCYFRPSGTYYFTWIRAQGYGADAGLRLVRGEDGLRCAVEGSIEGASCDLASHTAGVLDTPNSTRPGFSTAASGTVYGNPYSAGLDSPFETSGVSSFA